VAEAAAEAAGLVAVPAEAVALREGGDMYFTLTASILCGIVVLWYLLTYNSLVKARNAVDQAWSHIEVELKRRFDLIQNLVEIVKGYAAHESDTFKKVAALRNSPRPFGDAAAANSAQPELARTFSQIMVLAENYPQLRADQSFLNLQKQLTETENRIAERRHAYNQTVNAYLNLLQKIPSNVVANIQEMPPRSFFDEPDTSIQQPPAIKLS
jgi:LemA protein